MAKVEIAPEADADITAIFEYLLDMAGLEAAATLVEELDTAIMALANLPERGKYPPELLAEGITLFREWQCSPWRIFYRVVDGHVWVVAVLGGRRNISQLLPERLALS